MKKKNVAAILLLILLAGGPYISVRQAGIRGQHTPPDISQGDVGTTPGDGRTLQDASEDVAQGTDNTPQDASEDAAQGTDNIPQDASEGAVQRTNNIPQDAPANETAQKEDIMAHPDRITYQEGFYYEPITDEIKNRIYGLSYKEDCTVPYEELRYIKVLYHDFDGKTAEGEIICNKAIAQDLVEIFSELFANNYPIEKIRLIDEYDADDDLSCADNNTSSFNYRVVAGTKTLSKHALGMAIDINPFYNPYITYPDGKEHISPPGSEPYADRNADLPHMIKKGDLCYELFIKHGFSWGGEWKSVKDYQHFQKE